MAKFKVGDLVVGVAKEKQHIEATVLLVPHFEDRMIDGKRLVAGWYLIEMSGNKKAQATEDQMKYPDDDFPPEVVEEFTKLMDNLKEKA